MLIMQRDASRFCFLAAARFNYRDESALSSSPRYRFVEAFAGRGIVQVARCVMIERSTQHAER